MWNCFCMKTLQFGKEMAEGEHKRDSGLEKMKRGKMTHFL